MYVGKHIDLSAAEGGIFTVRNLDQGVVTAIIVLITAWLWYKALARYQGMEHCASAQDINGPDAPEEPAR